MVSFTDGVLAGARAEAVRAHLAVCPGCREALDQLAAYEELVHRDEKPEVPAYLGTRVTARERQGRTRQWLGLVASETLARIVSLVLVAVGIWLGTVLARATVGPQQSFADLLAQIGLELPNGGHK